MNRLRIYKQALADYKETREDYTWETMHRLRTDNGFCFYLNMRHHLDTYQIHDRYRLVPELAEVITNYEEVMPDGIIRRGHLDIEWIDIRITMLKIAITLYEHRHPKWWNLWARFLNWITS